MLKAKFRKGTVKFEKGSLGAKYLNELKGTKTLKAFEQGGESTWRRYFEEVPLAPRVPDDFRRGFFRQLLGAELYDALAEANEIEPHQVLHNRYLAWGRANVCDLEVE